MAFFFVSIKTPIQKSYQAKISRIFIVQYLRGGCQVAGCRCIKAGTESIKLYTIYAPANHIDGRIHHTKADAAADVADEEFGKKQ